MSYPFTSYTRWHTPPPIKVDFLSCGGDFITIKLPQANYEIGGRTITNRPLEATFSIGMTVEGTPIQVLSRLTRDSTTGEVGTLLKYVEGNNTWLIGREVCLLNGKVAFLSLPTEPQAFIVGAVLMESSSKLTKLLKERVIPDIVTSLSMASVSIMDTRDFIVEKSADCIRKALTEDTIEKILLDNIDKRFL